MDIQLTFEKSDLNQTDKSLLCAKCDKFVILASNLKHKNQRLLGRIAVKHKFKIFTTYRYKLYNFCIFYSIIFTCVIKFYIFIFRSSVTHVIVETNEQNMTKLTLDVLFTIVRGNWLLNSGCKMKYYYIFVIIL